MQHLSRKQVLGQKDQGLELFPFLWDRADLLE